MGIYGNLLLSIHSNTVPGCVIQVIQVIQDHPSFPQWCTGTEASDPRPSEPRTYASSRAMQLSFISGSCGRILHGSILVLMRLFDRPDFTWFHSSLTISEQISLFKNIQKHNNCNSPCSRCCKMLQEADQQKSWVDFLM